ncbi:MAG TPA: hypothetical protein VK147_11525 [Candidatus Didemnitutus sp.]|nr:hypothetical protein [Candidatus Didemnitutus sp.]
MFFKVSAIALAVVTLASCTGDGQGPSGTEIRSGQNPKEGGNVAAIARPSQTIKFDHLARTDGRCPNLGPNCALTPRPKPPKWALDDADVAIAAGPSGVASFFADTSNKWQLIAMNIDTAYPSVYNGLITSQYWMFRTDDPDDTTRIAFYIGPANTSPSYSNTSYKFVVDK